MNETTISNFIILTPSKFLTLFVLGNPKLLSFSFYFQSPEHLLTFLLISISFMGHVSIGCAIYQEEQEAPTKLTLFDNCLLYTSPSPRDQRGSRMPSSA